MIVQQIVDPTQAVVAEVIVASRAGSYSHTLLTFEDGSTVAWKDSGRLAIRNDLAGVLKRDQTGRLKWIEHTEIMRRFVKNDVEEFQAARKQVFDSWDSAFLFSSDKRLRAKQFDHGLHQQQIGALHAIGAYWSVSTDRATIVMPTGTGKSDVMVATLLAYIRDTLVVVVPSSALRNQTFHKFLSLGLLRQLGHLKQNALNPVVGLLTGRLKTTDDLSLFDSCNVVVTTMSMIAQGTSEGFGTAISERCGHLMIDEAHHVAARTWSNFRDALESRPTLQFTATPFRRDKKVVEGSPIYKYSLAQAQVDGFFTEIQFHPVVEPDPSESDEAIAVAAIKVLRQDLAAGHEHLLLARTARKSRADDIIRIYERLAPDFSPIVVYSDQTAVQDKVDLLRAGKSKIVVCVDMLGEGFDLPQLKIAAVHDAHKSLAILLQFVGRFTRTMGSKLGTATVVANTSQRDITATFQELYDEDADWNVLLKNYSSQAVRDYAESIELLEEAEAIELTAERLKEVQLSPSSLKPKFSTVVYSCDSFRPLLFAKGLPATRVPQKAWFNRKKNLFFFVTAENPHIDWSNSRTLLDLHWHFYVMYYQPDNKLLFIHSSDNSSLHSELATAVGGTSAAIVSGESVFRVFAGIKRLLLHSVGLKRRITGRNLRFSQHMGADIAEALSSAQTASSTKSNIYATGYENGDKVDIGCSHKGRIWTREQGTLRGFLHWCDHISAKLLDTTFDTTQLISDALIYEEVTEFPESQILSLLWPDELWQKTEANVKFKYGSAETPLFDCSIGLVAHSKQELKFSIETDALSVYSMRLLSDRKTVIAHESGPRLSLSIGRNDHIAEQWFAENPPEILFVDGSELDGTLWIHPQRRKTPSIPEDCFEVWDWTGVDLSIESMWSAGTIRKQSIEYHVASTLLSEFDIIFDDDGSGEAADLICLKSDATSITVRLIHCKYSHSAQPGARVKDVVEVCSQAVRSHKWKHRFEALCTHIQNRERSANSGKRKTRFVKGDIRMLRTFVGAAKQKQPVFEIYVVQPGVTASNVTVEQKPVLASAYSFLLDTIDIPLRVISSA